MFDPIRAQGDPTGPREVRAGGGQGMGTRRTGYGDTEDEWGRCPGAARCSEPTWDACLGNQGEIIRPRFQFWLGRGKKKEKKKEKEAKKKRD